MTPVFIYTLNDPTTGIVRYCGQTVDPDDRLAKHLGTASKRKYHCARWVNSLLSKNLLPIMEILDVVPDDEADFWEREYIQNFLERGFDLTNFTKGGGGRPMLGKKHSPETLLRQRKAKLGKKQSPEHRAKYIRDGEKNSFFGKKHSPETRAKIRAARLGTKMSPESSEKKRMTMLGEKNPFFRKKHTPKSLAKMAATQFKKGTNKHV